MSPCSSSQLRDPGGVLHVVVRHAEFRRDRLERLPLPTLLEDQRGMPDKLRLEEHIQTERPTKHRGCCTGRLGIVVATAVTMKRTGHRRRQGTDQLQRELQPRNNLLAVDPHERHDANGAVQ